MGPGMGYTITVVHQSRNHQYFRSSNYFIVADSTQSASVLYRRNNRHNLSLLFDSFDSQSTSYRYYDRMYTFCHVSLPESLASSILSRILNFLRSKVTNIRLTTKVPINWCPNSPVILISNSIFSTRPSQTVPMPQCAYQCTLDRMQSK